MKVKLLILMCVLLGFTTHAQKKKPAKKTPQTKIVKVDSTELLNLNQLKNGLQQVQDQIEASLTGKDLSSSQNGEKRFYDSYKLFLHAGEELTLEHSSDNFRVMLGLKTPTKDKQEMSYDTKTFNGSSYNKFFYVAPATGTYTLLATSMDANQTGKYRIQKLIATPNAAEAQLDPAFTKQFKTLMMSKQDNFKSITGEKIKKDKKDKTVGQERFKTSFELVAGKSGLILQDNGGQTSNYKTFIFESENEDEAKQYFEKIKKQLQVLARSWTEQSNTDNLYSASTDKDIITLNIASEERKKKKIFYMVGFVYN
ncbi:MAG: hypothetical protein V4585_12290 [Bacteroidota bacterium]